jgi:hypothetical protein
VSSSTADDLGSFARGPDGTRLFVHRKPGGSPSEGGVHAIFCDGILCDGFIWKYMWGALAPFMPVVHWH